MSLRKVACLTSLIAFGALGAVSAQAPRSVWSGVYSPAQADRGKAAFAANCAACHGADLQGIEMAPPLVGAAFLSNWDRQSLGDLADRIKTTMPADDPGKLGQAAVADVVAFILSVNQAPAGATDLPREAAAQKLIRIEAAKPS